MSTQSQLIEATIDSARQSFGELFDDQTDRFETEEIVAVSVNGDHFAAQLLSKMFDEYPWLAINAEQYLGEEEPVGGDIAAVCFKLGIGADWPLSPHQLLVVMGSDVDYFNPLGQRQHKISRGGELTAAEQTDAIDQLTTTFSADEDEISVNWIISFGVRIFMLGQDGQVMASTPHLVRTQIRAEIHQPPTREEIAGSFNPKFNPGFGLLELLPADRATLRVRPYKGEDVEDISNRDLSWQNIDQELAAQLVINKVLPPAMLVALIAGSEGTLVSAADDENSDSYLQVELPIAG